VPEPPEGLIVARHGRCEGLLLLLALLEIARACAATPPKAWGYETLGSRSMSLANEGKALGRRHWLVEGAGCGRSYPVALSDGGIFRSHEGSADGP
jgi:hypothetical protein